MRRENFLFCLCIAFIAGNLATSSTLKLVPVGFSHIPILIVVASLITAIVLSITLHKKGEMGIYIQTSFLITFFLLGSLVISINEKFKLRTSDSILIGNARQQISGSITEIGKTKKGLPKLEISIGKESIILYIRESKTGLRAEVGDRITGIITPTKISNFDDKFDYISYMQEQNIFYTSFTSQKEITVTPITSPSKGDQIKRLRNKFDKYLSSIIKFSDGKNKEAYSIIKALTIGDKSNIGSDLKDSFQKSGTMHLLALSGLHVGIIYKLLTYIFSILGNFPKIKKTRSVIIIIILGTYAIFTGFSTSILRAVIMASIYEVSTLLRRDKNKLNTLAISALAITLLIPNAPSQIGFQLSFTAMLGIFTLYPILRNILPRKLKLIRPLWDTISISLACQIFTAPLIYHYFRTFSHFSLFSNLLALPLTSIIMALTPVFLIFPNITYLEESLTFTVNLLIEIISLAKEVSDGY